MGQPPPAGDDLVAFTEEPFQFFMAERMGDASFFILFQRWRREDIRLPAFAEIPNKKADHQRPGVTGIHIFCFPPGTPYIHHFLPESLTGVMFGTVTVKKPYVHAEHRLVPRAGYLPAVYKRFHAGRKP